MLHACAAYHLLILGVHNAVRKRGRLQWESALFPLATVRNASLNAVQVMKTCLWGAAVDPSIMAEHQQERHYGRIKGHFKGSPSLRDGVMGVQKTHLQQMRRPTHHDVPKRATITCAEAVEISKESWRFACQFQSWLSCSRSPQTVAEDMGRNPEPFNR